jgi:predicted nucleotidyltransferase
MGTIKDTSTSGLASALFGRTRLSILSLLFINDEDSFYLREIMRTIGQGRGSVQRELARLVDAGLVTRSARGNQVFFQANKDSPVFSELRSLLVKTAGIADVIRVSLSEMRDKIRIAFIHGSFAQGTDTAVSDVDLITIGEASLREVVSILEGAQASIGREINPVTYSVGEFHEKFLADHHFVRSFYRAPKIFLIGNEDELKRLAEKGMAG